MNYRSFDWMKSRPSWPDYKRDWILRDNRLKPCWYRTSECHLSWWWRLCVLSPFDLGTELLVIYPNGVIITIRHVRIEFGHGSNKLTKSLWRKSLIKKTYCTSSIDNSMFSRHQRSESCSIFLCMCVCVCVCFSLDICGHFRHSDSTFIAWTIRCNNRRSY